eukprot:CAMPEP_0117528760 /NCGR_PEP_ID=MMETSP0784-20121206/37483_1 /TAXON_ID=39447 /ORGANISM="" /LENGTH=104 /DNA_ID=CAMNT_0005325061 /DNA_START=70 /DNA_END=384 /DNA_ORIENTATION=-
MVSNYPMWRFLWFFLAALSIRVAFCEEDTKKKQPTDAEVAEYKQDFVDFDLNKDNKIDAQEVRSQFKGDLDPTELHQFFIDADKDSTGTVTLEEYIDYAATLIS